MNINCEFMNMTSTDNLALVISLLALLASVVGWIVVHYFNIKATDFDRKNNFQLKVYENILNQTNTLLKMISSYTASAQSHTHNMAQVLNKYRSLDDMPDFEEKINTQYELKRTWIDTAYELGKQSFEIQRSIEDYLRYLDMNGTDYTRGTPLYDALLKIKADAYNAAEQNRKRWNDHEKIDKLTPENYDMLALETKTDADIVFEFGMCIDDVLTIIYNKSIANILDKPHKQLDTSANRRIITEDGVIDNRTVKERTT